MVAGSTFDVIVVGAGVSGIAAARKLVAAGLNVVVFEARNRVGGRVDTRTPFGYPIDYGASWIHGWTGNPVLKLVREGAYPFRESEYENMTVFDSDGQRLSAEAVDRMSQKYWSLIGAANEQSTMLPDQSLAALLKTECERADLSPSDYRFVEWMADGFIKTDYAADLDVLSAAQYTDQALDNNNGFLPEGYGRLVSDLAAGLPVRFNSPVKAVEVAGLVTVRLGSQAYQARQVVITLPLGLLQSNALRFEPELPASKQAALDSLHMGLLNKIFLHFPHVFWPESTEFFGQIGSELIRNVLNLKYFNDQNCLVAFVAGRQALALEQESIEFVIERLVAELRDLFGAHVPEPLRVDMTRWASDPYAQGSYSSVPVGAQRSARAELARPIADKLFFAGEATEPDFAATVHGAFMSGERAAAEILALNA